MEINGIEEKERVGTKIRSNTLLLITEGLFQCPHLALTAVFETVRKHLFKQPVDGNLPATGCLISFEYGYCYND